MKNEIDLRPPEFVSVRSFYWPRFMRLLLFALLGVGIVGGGAFGYLYLVMLEMEVADIQHQNNILREEVKPVEEMEQDIANLQAREDHLGELKELRLPWSDYIKDVDAVAADDISVHSISASDGGSVSISGTGVSMAEVVLFVQKLEQLDFLYDLSYSSVSREEANRYAFSLAGELVKPQ